MPLEKICLDCQKPLIGRVDKKFCDDQCRSNYNNKIRNDDNSFMKQVNQILKKNWQILKAKNPTGKVKVKKTTLSTSGFDFNYHTHILSTQKGSAYFFCYEYGYLLLEGNEVLLVKREEK